jgi:hypothetical protein
MQVLENACHSLQLEDVLRAALRAVFKCMGMCVSQYRQAQASQTIWTNLGADLQRRVRGKLVLLAHARLRNHEVSELERLRQAWAEHDRDVLQDRLDAVQEHEGGAKAGHVLVESVKLFPCSVDTAGEGEEDAGVVSSSTCHVEQSLNSSPEAWMLPHDHLGHIRIGL